MVVRFNSPNKNECILSFDGARLKIEGTEFKILHMWQKFNLQKRKKKNNLETTNFVFLWNSWYEPIHVAFQWFAEIRTEM